MKWEDIVKLALKLPEAEESTSYGKPALKVRGKGFCYLNNPEDVVFHLANVDEQQFLIEASPKVYYITPHYIGWASVRARLKALTKAEAQHRLEQSWRLRAPPKLLKDLAASGQLPAFMQETAPSAKKATPKKTIAKKKSVKKAGRPKRAAK